jgi:hypothetical protein
VVDRLYFYLLLVVDVYLLNRVVPSGERRVILADVTGRKHEKLAEKK